VSRSAAESLVTPHRVDGAITVRGSALFATAIIIAAGCFALRFVRLSGAARAVAPPVAAQAADISTITERPDTRAYALRSPTSPPVRTQRPDPALVSSDALTTLPPVAPAPLVEPPTSTRQNVSESRQRRPIPRALIRSDSVSEARNADLVVNLNGAAQVATDVSKPSTPQPASAPDFTSDCECVLQRGTIIPASLYTPIDSTVPGPIAAQVRQDVYDSTHRQLLIPQGSRLTGSYANGVANGQARLFVGFDLVKLPNGRTIELSEMPGVDLQGVAGLGGKVDFHTGRLFGSVVLLSVLDAAAQLAQQNGSRPGNIIVNTTQQTAGQQASNVASQIANQYLNQKPTMHTAAGFILDVVVQHELRLRPYAEQ